MRFSISVRCYVALMLLIVGGCKSTDFSGESERAPALAPLQTLNFLQITRPTKQTTLTQGRSGAVANEDYNVSAFGVLDLLIVIDNSGSMSEEQANLAARMAPLLSSIKDSDWRIAVTTTDANDNCITDVISKGDSGAEADFRRAINAGIRGDGLERPILRAVTALKPSCRSWLRSNSTIAVLIVTDEDNCHIDLNSGYGCAGEVDKEGAYLTNYLSSIRTVGTEARVYGLFRHPSQSQGQCSTAMKSADIVASVVAATSGTWGSICDSDYSATLTRISSDVAKILKTDFVLKSLPDPGTLVITVNGQAWTQFTQTGLLIHFTTNPPTGATVRVNYRSGSVGIVGSEFDIPEVPFNGSVTATINGAPAPVTWDAARSKVVFSGAPTEGATLVISYKENRSLVDSFTIAPDADTRYLKVKVNGQVIPSSAYTYDTKTGIVKFKEAPAESAAIMIEWRGKKKLT